ncbi:hypothetical protein C8J57DRAFT_1460258 [Mycena rebaudengoi]|nr:hypothetical protein C8J57DRAFT_1460258 [Mycena rebaudengoi]
MGKPSAVPTQILQAFTSSCGNSKAQCVSGASAGPVNRTVYIGNLPPSASVDELLNLVHFDPLRVLPEKSCVFLSFLDAPTAKALTLHNQELKVGWGKPSAVPAQVLQATTQSGASRNVYLGGLDEGMTEEMLRDELGRFGLQVKIVRDKGIGFVQFLSVGVATKVVSTLPPGPASASTMARIAVPKSQGAAGRRAESDDAGRRDARGLCERFPALQWSRQCQCRLAARYVLAAGKGARLFSSLAGVRLWASWGERLSGLWGVVVNVVSPLAAFSRVRPRFFPLRSRLAARVPALSKTNTTRPSPRTRATPPAPRARTASSSRRTASPRARTCPARATSYKLLNGGNGGYANGQGNNANGGRRQSPYTPYTPKPFSPDALSAMMNMNMFGMGMAGGGMSPGGRGGLMNPISPGTVMGAMNMASLASGVIGSRAIYLSNIHPETSTEDLYNSIRGGVLQSVRYMADKHIALSRTITLLLSCLLPPFFVILLVPLALVVAPHLILTFPHPSYVDHSTTFIDPAAAFTFFQVSSYQGLTLNSRCLKIGWGKNSGLLPPTLALAVHADAQRLHRQRGGFEVFSEERLKADFGEFGDIELVNFLKEKTGVRIRRGRAHRAARADGGACERNRGPNSAEPQSAIERGDDIDPALLALQDEGEEVAVKEEEKAAGVPPAAAAQA